MLWLSPAAITAMSSLVAFFFALDKIPSYWTGAIAADERCIFFPTCADQINQTHWNLPIHGWIFEPEDDSKKRIAFLKLLAKSLQVSDPEQKNILKRRMRPFVVDNQSLKRPKITLLGKTYRMPRSFKNGHFKTSLVLHKSQLQLPVDHNRVVTLPFHAIDQDRNFQGQVHCVPPAGVSVISDIDDTIKDTNYLDKKEFMKNTFLKEFRAVPGMPELYHKWNSEFENCCFHFVSASPYQLYEELDAFVRNADFPAPVTFHLKTVRPKDQTILQLFADPVDYKRKHIESILNRFPQRQFHLVGDSGEKDPEIYAGIYKDYPDQVAGIWIRNINNATADRLANVPASKWRYFENGYDLLE